MVVFWVFVVFFFFFYLKPNILQIQSNLTSREIGPAHIIALDKYFPTSQNESEYQEHHSEHQETPYRQVVRDACFLEKIKSHKAALVSEGQPCLFVTSRCHMEIRCGPGWHRIPCLGTTSLSQLKVSGVPGPDEEIKSYHPSGQGPWLLTDVLNPS